METPPPAHEVLVAELDQPTIDLMVCVAQRDWDCVTTKVREVRATVIAAARQEQ